MKRIKFYVAYMIILCLIPFMMIGEAMGRLFGEELREVLEGRNEDDT